MSYAHWRLEDASATRLAHWLAYLFEGLIMNCCCNGGAPAAPPTSSPPSSSARPASWLRRVSMLTQWAIPLVTLALIPKCPACVAAYLFLFTGIGVSFHIAAAMRWSLIALSILPLTYLVLAMVWRFVWRRLA